MLTKGETPMARTGTTPEWRRAFTSAGEMLGHRVAPKNGRNGNGVRIYWVECSCGYASSPGKSFKFAMNSGVGHLQRISERLSPPEPNQRRTASPKAAPATRHDAITSNVGGR